MQHQMSFVLNQQQIHTFFIFLSLRWVNNIQSIFLFDFNQPFELPT